MFFPSTSTIELCHVVHNTFIFNYSITCMQYMFDDCPNGYSNLHCIVLLCDSRGERREYGPPVAFEDFRMVQHYRAFACKTYHFSHLSVWSVADNYSSPMTCVWTRSLVLVDYWWRLMSLFPKRYASIFARASASVSAYFFFILLGPYKAISFHLYRAYVFLATSLRVRQL
jgi:hypothetical protein